MNKCDVFSAAGFHPVTTAWFTQRFGAPTEPQQLGWPEIAAGRNTLIAAPTGSGKTLSAFLSCIDRLLRDAIAGDLPNETRVVYVTPLKALSNDIRRNLELPLAEINATAVAAGFNPAPIRALVRTGDTPASQRAAMLKKPPHILVTTPESLFLLVTSEKSRRLLTNVQTVIVDEIHALARDKRGSHLMLTLERLEAMCRQPPVRIGLSATQRPMDDIARFLVGSRRLCPSGDPDCSIVDVGHVRKLDLDVETPTSELTAVCSKELWEEVYGRLTQLIQEHRSTVVFVNTRRMAERVSHRLSDLLGENAVASHHGSLAKEIRLDAEQRLKNGELKAIVATASLELGIDIGYIDLVCQIGTPRAIATLLQRVGRSGHSLGAIPKGRIFALTRDELLECLSLLRAVRGRRLDKIEIPQLPYDILAQQIVATVAAEDMNEDALFELMKRAWPFRNLERNKFDEVLEMLSTGISHRGKRGAYLHRDRIHRQLRAVRGARIAAVTSGGAIPENAEYRVITRDEGTVIGTLNEDFAIESMAGDIFLLGNTSWRIEHVRGLEVVVTDANGQPATIPFWLGEGLGRTIELSTEVAELRREVANRVDISDEPPPPDIAPLFANEGNGDGAQAVPNVSLSAAVEWLMQETGAGEWSTRQCARYIAAEKAALGLVPTQRDIVFERFFDESGGMQLVIHAPFGARVNRAWGLAMRKRFCRSFDFELQAAADDNGIVLSLSPQHSFPLEDMFRMLNSKNGEYLLTQALLAAPMFQIRWRHNATRSLAVLRRQGGKRVPPPLQRFRSDDLLAAVFPASAGCFENHHGDMEIPDHPLVNQTIHDCLHEAMDLDRWIGVLSSIEKGEIRLVARDTREPSPFSHELLNANPYAFLDDAPLEERRARAVATRRTLSIEDFRDLGRLDPAAIEQVSSDAWPIVRDIDEMHEALLLLGLLPDYLGVTWTSHYSRLVESGRATSFRTEFGKTYWCAAEKWPAIRSLFPDAVADPAIALPPELDRTVPPEEASVSIVRGWIECSGPIVVEELANKLTLTPSSVEAALMAMEAEGFVMRGKFRATADADPVEWCERRLLARIHRLTLDGARRQVRPVEIPDFLQFLFEHQHCSRQPDQNGRDAVLRTIRQLQGFEAPAGAWETEILTARVRDYEPEDLDDLSLTGETAWGRLNPPKKDPEARPTGRPMTRVVPIAIVAREDLFWLLPTERDVPLHSLRGDAQAVFEALREHGALFANELLATTKLLPSQLDEMLGELAALGLVTADGFAPVRAITGTQKSSSGSRKMQQRRRRHTSAAVRPRGGRWSKFPGPQPDVPEAERNERWARQLLARYGVMFRDLLERESSAPAWGALAPIYRRLEARGEIRGGRFVRGVAGEQFALSESIEKLRKMREIREAAASIKDHPETPDSWIVISAADPLNLAGIVAEGARVPATAGNRLVFHQGRFVAAFVGGEVRLYEPLKPALADAMAQSLGRLASRRYPEETNGAHLPLFAES